MPVVIVELLEGRSEQQKRDLIAAITQAMVEKVNANAANLQIIIHEAPRTNWGRAGRPATEF